VAVAGCSTSSSNQSTADDAAETAPDVESDVSADTSESVVCTSGSVHMVIASNFDQSCTVNAECAAVGEGNACDPCTANCYNAAINFREVPRYLASFPKTPADAQSGIACTCPAELFSCCRDGMCHADLQCQITLAEAGVAGGAGIDAAADGGGAEAGADAASDGGPADAGSE